MNHASAGIRSSGSGATTRDEIYCHVIARRAVIRAALYLGIETMSQEALDTLSGILLEYISRIGSTLAATVEASGRSSAHCNALDALRVIELVTAPGRSAPIAADLSNTAIVPGGVATMPYPPAPSAAASGFMGDDIRNNNKQSSRNDLHQIESYTKWKDLADFCFGASFREAASKAVSVAAASSMAINMKSADDNQRRGSISSSGVRNGSKDLALKLNGSMIGNKNNKTTSSVTFSIDGVGLVQPGIEIGNDVTNSGMMNGWNAPYPDELDTFPICPSGDHLVANPHTLPEQSFHTTRSIPSLDNVPSALGPNSDGRIGTTTTTSISHQTVLDSIKTVRKSLDRIPDDIFTLEDDMRKYQQDFFTLGPTVGDRRRYERLETSTIGPATLRATSFLNTEQEPNKKKVKMIIDHTQRVEDNKDSDSEYEEVIDDDRIARRRLRRPVYIPKFYPPFVVPQQRARRTFIDTTDEIDSIANNSITKGPLDINANGSSIEYQRNPSTLSSAAMATTTISDSALIDSDTRRAVRSALVNLGKVSEIQPWGSIQLQDTNTISVTKSIVYNFDGEETHDANDTRNSTKDANDTGSLTVKAGRTGDGSSGTVKGTIEPLNRASGSRVSRILEGSMDQSAL